jgi:hypothetical protein
MLDGIGKMSHAGPGQGIMGKRKEGYWILDTGS